MLPTFRERIVRIGSKVYYFHIRLLKLLFVGGGLYEYSLKTKTNVFGMIIHVTTQIKLLTISKRGEKREEGREFGSYYFRKHILKIVITCNWEHKRSFN